jgi:hypothetical protein
MASWGSNPLAHRVVSVVLGYSVGDMGNGMSRSREGEEGKAAASGGEEAWPAQKGRGKRRGGCTGGGICVEVLPLRRWPMRMPGAGGERGRETDFTIVSENDYHHPSVHMTGGGSLAHRSSDHPNLNLSTLQFRSLPAAARTLSSRTAGCPTRTRIETPRLLPRGLDGPNTLPSPEAPTVAPDTWPCAADLLHAPTSRRPHPTGGRPALPACCRDATTRRQPAPLPLSAKIQVCAALLLAKSRNDLRCVNPLVESFDWRHSERLAEHLAQKRFLCIYIDALSTMFRFPRKKEPVG